MEKRENEARSIEWNDRPIVRVEATVMVRGELGFTPHLGYGNSRVAIYESLSRTEYLLYGYKIQDKKVTLDMLIPHRMLFTVATPIFHHWVIGEHRMGLSFNGTADARAFDRGIRVALENLEKAHMNSSTSSSASEDANSISPTSVQSFNLAFSDEPVTSEPCPSTKPQHFALLRQRVSNTLPGVSTFRQQTHSASSPRVIALLPQTQPQRRHSSSLPGSSVQPLSPQIPTPPSSATEPTTHFPVFCPRAYSSLESKIESQRPVEKKDAIPFPPPRLRVDTRERSSAAPDGRHRHRHRDEPRRHRTKRTKTPNLDHLERQRDLQPTKPNSYVQFASRRNHSVLLAHSQYFTSRIGGIGTGYHKPQFRSTVPGPQDYGCQDAKSQNGVYKKPFYSTGSNFNSFYDSNYFSLKQSSMLVANESAKKGKYKEDLSERSRCRNCLSMFNHDRNKPGSCPEAPPDDCERCIECGSCLPVARCVFYQCFKDSEGNYVHEPCSCSSYDGRMSRRRRWLILGLLSLVLPCLCLYPLFKSCHRCGVACHCCGGRHEPMPPPREIENSSAKQ